MFQLVADPTVRAARVTGCQGNGASHWSLITDCGRSVVVSHNWVEATGVKVGDYLVHKDGEWVGSVKPDVFQAMFALVKKTAPPAEVPFRQPSAADLAADEIKAFYADKAERPHPYAYSERHLMKGR